MYRILIVEDDLKIAELLADRLARYNFHPIIAREFDAVDRLFDDVAPHVVLIDVNLPMYDGYYWCRKLRARSSCPILFISVRTNEMDQVMAMEYGADDFVTKPFNMDVIVAKIRSQIRRAYGELSGHAPGQERIVSFHGLTLLADRLQLQFGTRRISITRKEAQLLELLIEEHPRPATREAIFSRLWDDETFVNENTLNVNVSRLRRHLADLGIEDAIETVKGVGYRLRPSWLGEEPSPEASQLEGRSP